MSSTSPETPNPLTSLSEHLTALVAQVESTVVAIRGRSRFPSSGIHWQPGIIVTSESYLKRSEEFTVILGSDALSARILGRDPSTDVAVLQMEAPDLPTAEISDETSVKVGQLVLALGRSPQDGIMASMGLVGTAGDAWQSRNGGLIDRLIRPEVNLYPRLFGGSLVDATGKVLGMNTSGPRRSPLTIPASTISRVVNQLLEQGQIPRGYLGLGMQPVALPESLRTNLSLDSEVGILVVSVESQGPADQGGVLLGDILLSIDGTFLEDVSDVQRKLVTPNIGQALNVQLIRGGQLVEVTVTPGERQEKERCC